MTVILTNNVSTTLAADITASSVSLTVTDGNRFPTPTSGQYFYATLVAPTGALEIVKVASRVGNVLSIARAQEGTAAQAFPSGARIDMRVTAQSIYDAVDDGAAQVVVDITTELDALEAEDVAINGRVDALDARTDALEAADLALYAPAGSNLVGFFQSGTGAAIRTVQAKLRETVSVKDFGAIGNGTDDDTDAFQAALDAEVPLYIPDGEYLITTGLQLPYGANLQGSGGVAQYSNSRCKIKFRPTTPSRLFAWKTAPSSYVFKGATIKGFCVNGNGTNTVYCLDLPYLYNGDIDFFAYGGISRWVRIETWIDCRLSGGVQGFSVCGVECSNLLGTGSGVSTTTVIDAYISYGPIAYLMYDFALFGIRIVGTVESVDSVAIAEKANSVEFDIYMENVPRTDAGYAFRWGRTGTVGAFYQSDLTINLRPGMGYSGGIPANTKLLDLGDVRQCTLSGYLANTRSILSTTSGTRSVVIAGLSTQSVARFAESASDIDPATQITITGLFAPDLVFPGDGFYSDCSLAGDDLELFSRARDTVTNRKLFTDNWWANKLVHRDKWGNFSNAIPMLRTSATSGWTFNGARLTPGEIVVHTVSQTGDIALWWSQRHSKDTGNSYAACSTVSGSATLTRASGFFPTEVGDWVTVSAGYASATEQRRVVSRAADYSTITLDSNATSTVSGTVTVATEAHQLVPAAFQGFRQAAVSPIGVVTPFFVGQEYLDTAANNWYKSTGLTTADWKLIG